MNDFKKGGGFGGNRGGGKFPPRRDFGGKPSFGGRPSFGGKPSFGGGRPTELFQATCADCGKTCEVPFRPNGRKPVFCKECFDKNGGRENGDKFTQKNFSRTDRNDFSPAPKQFNPTPVHDKRIDDLKTQIDYVNSKLDRIVQMLESAKPAKKSAPKKKTEKK